MKKLILAIIILASALTLNGCGSGDEGPSTKVNSYADAGTYTESVRGSDFNLHTNWTVKTTKGLFASYTSLQAPVGSPVSVGLYVNQIDGSFVGRTLSAAGATIPIEGILVFLQ